MVQERKLEDEALELLAKEIVVAREKPESQQIALPTESIYVKLYDLLFPGEIKGNKATKEYRDAIMGCQKNHLFNYYLGQLYEKAGQWEDAISAYQLAVTLKPQDKGIKKALELALKKKK